MNNQISLESAIRVVGQLLLHNGTTGVLSRSSTNDVVGTFCSDASKFCYIGAAYVVANKLLGKPRYWGSLSADCDNVLGCELTGEDWDSATDAQRTAWATTLANYKENA